ncbi:hypothetical protein ACLKA6_016753 [Drosophila palustris]
MSAEVLFACSKCFARHPYEELSSGQQLCKVCRGSTSVVQCSYCRSEFASAIKSQSACKRCEDYMGRYGKPTTCKCCKIDAAFGSSKCMRCASYEAKYGPPIQCDECKLRSAFDRRDENEKVNGKYLCWLCTCAHKRALLKAQQEGRISMSKKRPLEESLFSSAHSESSAAAKKPMRGDEIGRNADNNNASGGSDEISHGNGGNAAPSAITIIYASHRERIASLEKCLIQKDKELLEKDKQLTEEKCKHFENITDMRNRLKEVERLHDMKVDSLNRKIASLAKDLAVRNQLKRHKQS